MYDEVTGEWCRELLRSDAGRCLWKPNLMRNDGSNERWGTEEAQDNGRATKVTADHQTHAYIRGVPTTCAKHEKRKRVLGNSGRGEGEVVLIESV